MIVQCSGYVQCIYSFRNLHIIGPGDALGSSVCWAMVTINQHLVTHWEALCIEAWSLSTSTWWRTGKLCVLSHGHYQPAPGDGLGSSVLSHGHHHYQPAPGDALGSSVCWAMITITCQCQLLLSACVRLNHKVNGLVWFDFIVFNTTFNNISAISWW